MRAIYDGEPAPSRATANGQKPDALRIHSPADLHSMIPEHPLPEVLYFEDIVPGATLESPSLVVDREEMVSFARTWDPLPMHIDDSASEGGLSAPGLYVLAVKLRLIHRSTPVAVIASLGYDEIRFRVPLRAGDEVTLRQEWLERRPSSSKPDRGIVKVGYSLLKRDGTVVMSHFDTLLVRRRAVGA